MLINKLRHKDGTVEYSCSFSVHLEQDKNLIIENYWNVYEYPEADHYLNFQIWAANTQVLRRLVNALVNNLKEATGSPALFKTGAIPSLYVRQTTYRNHILELEIANPYGAKTIAVEGLLQRVEGAAQEKFNWEIPLSGTITEVLEIDTEAVYSLGLTLGNPSDGPADTVFFADGGWATDIDPNSENAQFMVFRDYQSRNDEDWLIERGVQISGKMNKQYAWYRALNNTFKEVSLDAYRTLTFETQSEKAMEMEIVLARPGQAWEEQLRKKILVHPGHQIYTLDLEAFKGDKELLNTINMVVFVLENKAQKPQDVRLELQKMRFSKQTLDQVKRIRFESGPEASVRVFPNPLAAQSEIGFFSSYAGKAKWKLTNSSGQVIRGGELTVIKGNNQHPFHQEKLPSGVYFLEVQLPDAEKLQTAIMVR